MYYKKYVYINIKICTHAVREMHLIRKIYQYFQKQDQYYNKVL